MPRPRLHSRCWLKWSLLAAVRMDIAGDPKCMLWRPIDSVLDMLEPPSAAPIMLIKQTPPECLRLLGQDQHLAVGLPSLQLAGSRSDRWIWARS